MSTCGFDLDLGENRLNLQFYYIKDSFEIYKEYMLQFVYGLRVIFIFQLIKITTNY